MLFFEFSKIIYKAVLLQVEEKNSAKVQTSWTVEIQLNSYNKVYNLSHRYTNLHFWILSN